jgi:PTH1 family peptidyl-tRNA hydrolase
VRVFILKPQTYMNLSGGAVREWLAYSGVAPGEDLMGTLLVVYDDLDLPPGKLRFRAQGSAGGHKGVESVISALGHDRFSRLRIGIGRREGAEAADYVLEPVDKTTREALESAARQAAETLPVWIEAGIDACMSRFNAPSEASSESSRTGEQDPRRGERGDGE